MNRLLNAARGNSIENIPISKAILWYKNIYHCYARVIPHHKPRFCMMAIRGHMSSEATRACFPASDLTLEFIINVLTWQIIIRSKAKVLECLVNGTRYHKSCWVLSPPHHNFSAICDSFTIEGVCAI